MGKWMDLALQLERETGNAADIRDIRDVSPPNVAIVSNVHANRSLSPDLIAGLDKLRTMPAPRITKPEVWPEIVQDAVSICNGSWASLAIDLGWHPLQLFGVEPSSDPDPWDYSLAVMMNGWPVVDVGVDYITLRKGNASRPFKRRPRPALTKYLWEL